MKSQKKMMLVVFGLVAAVLSQSVAAQTEHVVGGSVGWIIPQSGDTQEYVTWASGQKFVVGDILIFNFATNAHDVVESGQKLAITVSASATSPGASPSTTVPTSSPSPAVRAGMVLCLLSLVMGLFF
ncbi:hypothetical protein M0R45_031554 [Rubus argutus]|uniref:Phytocyanin domain-containing protein n=1 Tax=Rubus argutus TaxID=59490 RepID=A0AAW1WGY8_RUBAR